MKSATLLLAIAFSTNLQAASKLEFSGTDPFGKPAPSPTIYVNGNKARFEQPSQGLVILFDQTQDHVTMLNSKFKQYMPMSPKIMLARQKALKALHEQRLAKLPEAQRQKIQQAIQKKPGQVGALSKAQPTTFQFINQKKQVNGIQCQQATAARAGKVIRELCIADAKDLKLPPQDYATLQAMLQFFQAMANSSRSPGASDISPLATGQLKGIPIEAKQVGDPKRTATLMLKSVSQQAIKPQMLNIPSDYKAVKIPDAY